MDGEGLHLKGVSTIGDTFHFSLNHGTMKLWEDFFFEENGGDLESDTISKHQNYPIIPIQTAISGEA